MLCSVDTCYQELLQELLHAVQCCYMLHCVVEFCAAVLYVVILFLHVVQCCYMLPSVITCCAVLLVVTESYYIMCSVVTCYQELLHAVQCCYMLPRVIACCAVLLHVTLCC